MPCYDPRSDHNHPEAGWDALDSERRWNGLETKRLRMELDRLARLADENARVACEALGVIERFDCDVELSQEAYTWWVNHKAMDRLREQSK